jgi:hypothetical protein
MFMSRLYCGRRGDIRKYILQGRARALENQDFLAACNIMLLFDIVILIYHDLRGAPQIADFEFRLFASSCPAAHRCGFIPHSMSYLV